MNTLTHQYAKPVRVIGLIGGMSWESSAEYYKLINQEVRRRLGPLRSAKLLMYSVDFGAIQQAQHEERWDDAASELQDAARRLYQGGADCIVLCTNTMHKLADAISAAVPIPFLHIADPVGEAARKINASVLGLLGTRFTMEQSFMRERLAQHGLTILIPEEKERAEVHRIIYEELCAGIIRETSRKTYHDIIQSLAQRGAQAVILGCTEITLLINQDNSRFPVLDTTALHARAAVDFSLWQSQV
jgi:aspartate racemase